MTTFTISFSAPVEHFVDGRTFAVSEATVADSVVARVLYDYDVDEYRVQMRLAGAKWTKAMPRERVIPFVEFQSKKVLAA